MVRCNRQFLRFHALVVVLLGTVMAIQASSRTLLRQERRYLGDDDDFLEQVG